MEFYKNVLHVLRNSLRDLYIKIDWYISCLITLSLGKLINFILCATKAMQL